MLGESAKQILKHELIMKFQTKRKVDIGNEHFAHQKF